MGNQHCSECGFDGTSCICDPPYGNPKMKWGYYQVESGAEITIDSIKTPTGIKISREEANLVRKGGGVVIRKLEIS